MVKSCQPGFRRRRAVHSSNTNAGSPPSQAPAERRWTASETIWTSPRGPGVAPAWLAKAGRARNAAATAIGQARCAGSSTRSPRRAASTSRRQQIHPKRVSASTDHAPPWSQTSASDSPRMFAASQMAHIAPVRTDSASPVQTSTFMCVRRIGKFCGKRVDPITNAAKKTVPDVNSVAAKCAARIRASGSAITGWPRCVGPKARRGR